MDILRNVLRWIVLLGLIVLGLRYLNSTFYSLSAAGGPSTEVPNAWQHRALVNFGFTVASITTGVFLFKILNEKNVLKGVKLWGIWLLIMVLSIGLPPLKKFIQVDRCLDSGGAWSEKQHECQSSNV
jgi:hypothetical protein